MLSLLIFALIGLFLNQFAYLSAIQETNAGTATVLQYVCPVGILIYSCIKDRVAPTLGEIVSIIFAIGGTFLIATHGQLDQLSMTPAGLFWGLFSALTYALYIILPIALIKKWGSSLVIGVGMVIAGLVALPFTGVLQADIPTSLDFLLAFAGIILIGTVFAYTAFLKGASLIGPVKSSLLASIEPISAVFFAFLIMNEQFYPIDFLGMAMILFAVTLISLKDLFLEK
ncbi:membrane protein [Streptococcus pneumoniae]|nr:membrane protein [Streptococcus pneumoniae]VLR57007.1 membrane protein [Streptococcus pneumoniae]VOT20831.1 membrane protein [Streptococcus pneumoniae]VOT32281.1 membrane protein [Streptococcus pneumoniae]VQD60509.1 membrane protein [Streptococcus pneumoniae]